MPIKKVLYIITQSEWGGAQKYVFDLTENFLKEGIKVGVASGTESNDLFTNLLALESDKLILFREKHLVRAINPYHDFIEFWRLIWIIHKFKPDIVHLNSSKAGILGTFAGRLCRKKVIYTAHGFVFNENLSILVYLFYVWSEKISSWFRDKVITVSNYDFKSALKKNVIAEDKMQVVHNGIDLNLRDSLLSRVEARGKLKSLINASPLAAPPPKGRANAFGWEGGKGGVNARISVPSPILEIIELPETQIAGTVANFYENKGLKYLVEAANLAVKDMPNAVFILIGKGELESKLRKIIKDKKLNDKFFIIAAVPDAYKYFRAFDIFCLPSIKEGLSYTLIEALMAGLPAVATNAGGNSEIIKDGENGFIVPSKDAKVLAEKIKTLLKNDVLKNKMGEKSYKAADEFSLEKTAEETRRIYIDVLG